MGDCSRDRSHLSLNLKDLKPRETNNDSGLSPISLPLSLLDSTMLLSPEKILLAAQQHHQLNHQLQQQHHLQQQQQKLETPTPSNFFPKNVTRDQESFAEGFVEALQKLQGTTSTNTPAASIPTFQNNSPSTVKFLLSLAALTPTLSPSTANKPLLVPPQRPQTTIQNTNLSTSISSVDGRRLDVPKIVLNCNSSAPTTVPASLHSPTSSSNLQSSPSHQIENCSKSVTAGDIAKSYMNYQLAQLGQASSSSSAANSAADFLPQQIAPFNSVSSVDMGIPQALQQAQSKAAHNFIKQEPLQFHQNNNGMEHKIEPPFVQNPAQMNGSPQPAAHFSDVGHSRSGRSSSAANRGVDMGDQDVKKLERKRARNRLAASKCRQRKLQKIADLEQQVQEERDRSAELQAELYRLQTVIRDLEERLKAGQQQARPLINR